MRSVYKSSPIEQGSAPGYLRFFYITWNFIFVLILGTFTAFWQTNDFIIYGTYVCMWVISTYVSYLLGIKEKLWIMGILDTNEVEKTKMSLKAFLFSAIGYSAPIIMCITGYQGVLPHSFVLLIYVVYVIVFFWLSSRYIKIQLKEVDNQTPQ